MEEATETLLLVGLTWMAFKAVVTVLLLLGAGPVLRRTPLAPIVLRIEARSALACRGLFRRGPGAIRPGTRRGRGRHVPVGTLRKLIARITHPGRLGQSSGHLPPARPDVRHCPARPICVSMGCRLP